MLLLQLLAVSAMFPQQSAGSEAGFAEQFMTATCNAADVIVMMMVLQSKYIPQTPSFKASVLALGWFATNIALLAFFLIHIAAFGDQAGPPLPF